MPSEKSQQRNYRQSDHDRLIDEAHEQVERQLEKKRHIENQASRLFRLILTSLGLFLTIASITASFGLPIDIDTILGIKIWSLSEEFTSTFPVSNGIADLITYLLFLMLVAGVFTTFLDLVFFTPYWAYQVLSPTPSGIGPSDIQSLAEGTQADINTLVLSEYTETIEHNKCNLELLEQAYQKLWHHIVRGIVLGGVITILVYPAFLLENPVWAILAFSAVLIAILSIENFEDIQSRLMDFKVVDEWVDKSALFIFLIMLIGVLESPSFIDDTSFQATYIISAIVASVSAIRIPLIKLRNLILRNSLVFLIVVFVFLTIIAVDPMGDHVPDYLIGVMLSVAFAVFFILIPLGVIYVTRIVNDHTLDSLLDRYTEWQN